MTDQEVIRTLERIHELAASGLTPRVTIILSDGERIEPSRVRELHTREEERPDGSTKRSASIEVYVGRGLWRTISSDEVAHVHVRE